MSNSEADVVQRNVDFGTVLASARKSKNLTLDDIFEHLKIPLHVLKAIEANDLDALPAPTFTQGYIRAYAKHLEISEDNILEIYNRAVPHGTASDLKPRSNLPGETNSQSPIIKIITSLLIFAGLAAVIIGSYQYYQEKVGVMETERESKQQRFTGNSLDSPGGNSLEIKQNARMSEDGELIVETSDPFEPMTGSNDSIDTNNEPKAELVVDESVVDEPVVGDSIVSKPAATKPAVTKPAVIKRPESVAAIEEIAETSDRPAVAESNANENDIIEIFAEKGSWVEVRDASEGRLFYNTIPVGGHKVLVGQAPFSVSMGNAKSTRVVVNDLEVDVSAYIRSNNTAKFKVSTQGQNPVFH